jgi:phage host-nuclease inhibitor protein Gam
MKANQRKNKPAPVQTREDMETLVGEIAALKRNLRLLAVALDDQIQGARSQYEPQMTAHSQMLEEKTAQARTWAMSNPGEFGGGRSIECLHGTLGWRTGGPALRTLAGWDWDRVKEALKTKGADGYLRLKEEVNKQVLIADREAIGPEKLREIGLRVVQEEMFFVDPKLTEAPELAARA